MQRFAVSLFGWGKYPGYVPPIIHRFSCPLAAVGEMPLRMNTPCFWVRSMHFVGCFLFIRGWSQGWRCCYPISRAILVV